ncbi:MAG: NeuD/PglB/VioB family sugar acetyltransferase, partial [Bacteroidetes bacterium]|nr:NeuD/PglB/VioB family sugar acetyltransferase [Bacteroidota bacterium]
YIKGILDEKKMNGSVLNIPVIGNDNSIDQLLADNYFFITVGQIKSAEVRKRLFFHLKNRNAKIATVVSPSAAVSKYVNIGEGTIIHHQAVVNAGAKIGSNCIINTNAVIEHDAQIGNQTHISTGCLINGDVIVGDECFVGSGAVISNGVRITDKVIIGAGSLLIKDIKEPGTYAGSPLKRIS